MKLTAAWLRRHKACEDQVLIFEREWPEGAELSAENLRRARRLNLDFHWLNQFAPKPVWETYYVATVQAWGAYSTAIAPAQGAYVAALASARKAYDAAVAQELEAYGATITLAWMKFIAPALK